VAVLLLALLPSIASGATDRPEPGRTTEGTVTSNGTEYPYLLHTPASYKRRQGAPLVVVVHGCQTTAEQEMELTLYNRLAEREGFVVLYPEVDEARRSLPGPLNHCWRFEQPSAYFRDQSDAAAIADMTRAAMASRAIKAQRVYVVGVSAGGLMAAVEAAAYPELFAAVGLVASAGYADGPCFTTGVGIPVESSAQLAFEQMGPRARVVPRFVIGSDADLAFPAACSDKALEQGLRTNNLVLSGDQTTPLLLAPASVREKRKRGGHAYTVSRYRDPDGCLIGKKWIIHGMPHAWPGGTKDPEYAGYTDTKAPSGAKGSWAFLSRFTKRKTSMPCAEARAPR
jgi:poly(hydroxyalkanoate) depolymerase family esterase